MTILRRLPPEDVFLLAMLLFAALILLITESIWIAFGA